MKKSNAAEAASSNTASTESAAKPVSAPRPVQAVSNASPKPSSKDNKSTQIMPSEHLHASNCGHKSFMHGTHVDYLLPNGKYETMVDGKSFPCTGPGTPLPSAEGGKGKKGVVLPFPSKGKK